MDKSEWMPQVEVLKGLKKRLDELKKPNCAGAKSSVPVAGSTPIAPSSVNASKDIAAIERMETAVAEQVRERKH